jgi:hypothetical protein
MYIDWVTLKCVTASVIGRNPLLLTTRWHFIFFVQWWTVSFVPSNEVTFRTHWVSYEKLLSSQCDLNVIFRLIELKLIICPQIKACCLRNLRARKSFLCDEEIDHRRFKWNLIRGIGIIVRGKICYRKDKSLNYYRIRIRNSIKENIINLYTKL